MGNLEPIAIAKQEVAVEIQKINMCVLDSKQNDSWLHMSSSFLFNIGKVRHFYMAKNRI